MSLFTRQYYYKCCCEAHVHQASFIIALLVCILWVLFAVPIIIISVIREFTVAGLIGVIIGVPCWLLFVGNRCNIGWMYWPYLAINILILSVNTLASVILPMVAVLELFAPMPKHVTNHEIYTITHDFPILVYVVFEIAMISIAYVGYHSLKIVLNSYRYIEECKEYARRPKRLSRISKRSLL